MVVVEPKGFQLELNFIFLAPLQEERLGACQLAVP